mmetsp:Transcript_9386/g.22125  ORF Transcript_9386/g.22125 Transcript_9386/m.22125 type:complete len:461 (-) Transcript_9386:308-1690(-)
MKELSDSGRVCEPEVHGELSAKLRAARPRLLHCIEEHAMREAEALDEVILQGLLALLEELDNSLASTGMEEGGITGQSLEAGSVENDGGPGPQDVEDSGSSLGITELEEMRQLLHKLQCSNGDAADKADDLHKAQLVHARLIAFITQRADHPTEEPDEEYVANLVTLLDEFDSVLEGHDAATHSQGVGRTNEAFPPRPVAQPPSVQEQEMYDFMMARFLQAQELEQDPRLAHLLALDMGAEGRPWTYRSPIAAPLGHQPLAPCGELRVLGLPNRAAPPARVIQVSGETPELLIGDGGVSEVPGSTSSASSAAPQLQSKTQGHGSSLAITGSESLSQGLLGNSASASKKSWARWAPSSTLSGPRRGCENGNNAQDYGQLEDDATPLVPGSAPGGTMPSRGLLPWRRQSKKGEQHEALLSRVQVDDEWELVRPPAERPYWYNSATGISQWEPPSFIMATSST